jgi:hypothetical protein
MVRAVGTQNSGQLTSCVLGQANPSENAVAQNLNVIQKVILVQ